MKECEIENGVHHSHLVIGANGNVRSLLAIGARTAVDIRNIAEITATPISRSFVSFPHGRSPHYTLRVFTYTTCNVLGLCKRFYFAILLVWLTRVSTDFIDR